MAFYTGVARAEHLLQTIVDVITSIHPGETAAWWKNEASHKDDGMVLTSVGSTGTERIVLIFKEGTIGSDFQMGIARDYTPGAVNTMGVFDTEELNTVDYYNTTQNIDVPVTYNLSVTEDRVIIHLQGDKLIASWQNPVVFLGMPTRYDLNDKKCIVKASSEDDYHANLLTVIEDSIGQTLQNYSWYYVGSPGNPSWGNHFFIETLHFGLGSEGLRGEIDGLYGSHDDGLVDGDIIDVNGTNFLVIKRGAYGNNAFPRSTLFMRMD